MKDIPGYEGYYAITKDGKVWSYFLKNFMSAPAAYGSSQGRD